MPTTLTAGDIAVIGINADDAYPTQRWAFVPLVNLDAGTVIHFTDAGVTSVGDFFLSTTTEGHMSAAQYPYALSRRSEGKTRRDNGEDIG